MKIGIMGGTFNPIHNAHIYIARSAKEQYELDRIVFMPSGNPPHKKSVTDKKYRYEMTRLAVGNEFDVSDYEVNKEEYSYTLNTLKYFHTIYPDDEIYFIIGEDSLNDIFKWYKPQEIVKLCKLLVFPRLSLENTKKTAKAVMEKLDASIYVINSPIFDVSSTKIREMIKNGDDVQNLISKEVLEYINENELYR